MKIGTVQLICDACGAMEIIGPFKTKRAFMTVFNRFIRLHVWTCEYRARVGDWSRRKPNEAEKHKRVLRNFQISGTTKQ